MRPEELAGPAGPAVRRPWVPTREARPVRVRRAPPLRVAQSMRSRREQARSPELPTTVRRRAIQMPLHPPRGALPTTVRAPRWPPMKARAAHPPAPPRERPMKAPLRRVPRLGSKCPMHSPPAREERSRLEAVPRLAARAAAAARPLPVPMPGAGVRPAVGAAEPRPEVELGQVLEVAQQECAAVPMPAPARRPAVPRRRVGPRLAPVQARRREHAARLRQAEPAEPADSGVVRPRRRPTQGRSRRPAFPASSKMPSVTPARLEPPVLPKTAKPGRIPRSAGCQARAGREAGPSSGWPRAAAARPQPSKRPIPAWGS